MTDKNTFYVTTPIYYPNDIPNIGHAYTTIAADILARWNSLLEKEVFFLTGTDEHGKKIESAAEKAGKKPKTFVDALVPEFKSAWKKLNIKYDRFIRTTDPDHEQVVQVILSEVHKKGDIYEGYYEGHYCTACEAYYTEKDLVDECCPIHKIKIEKLKEESYFFKLSKYQKKLLDYYKKNPEFISPENRKQEIINRVKEGLQDISISRTSFKWGIPLPFDKNHITWVWFDALPNYISGIGYLENSKQFKKFWPADVHIVGKEIFWFHAVIWPAMLMAAGIELPKKVFAHGWWTFEKEKISKSRGKVVNVDELISIAGVDSARYFLFREAPFGQDGDFSERALIERHNNELADKLGNLISRVSTLAEKYGLKEKKGTPILEKEIHTKVAENLENLEFDKALNEIFALIDKCNEYVQEKKPWETKDSKVLYELANAIKVIAILLSPFMPETCKKIAKTFNFKISLDEIDSPLKISKIKKSEILFKKINIDANEHIKKDDKQTHNRTSDNNLKSQNNKIEGIANMNTIKYEDIRNASKKGISEQPKNLQEQVNFSDFTKLDLRVGTIKKVEDIEGADKLYKLDVEIGKEKRTILAGLKKHYEKDNLKGKQVIVICNLEPRKMKGVESQGMLLAAVSDDESKVVLIKPKSEVESGSIIEFKHD